MITPKEKASQLLFDIQVRTSCVKSSKKTPVRLMQMRDKLIASFVVDEIIELYEFHAISNPDDKRVIDTLNYFDEVKQEIKKL